MSADAPGRWQAPPHMHGGDSVRRMMALVLVALLPGAVAMLWLAGWGVLLNLFVCCAAAVAAEAACLRLRGAPLSPLGDLSALVCGALLALALPPAAPWWLAATAAVVGIALGKQAFGGLGRNLFNPAMTGYAMVLVCFPAWFDDWSPALWSLGEAWRHSLGAAGPDAVSGATPLALVKAQAGLRLMVSEMPASELFGVIGAHRWEWVNLAFLAGGVLLLVTGVVRWHLPAGFLLGVAIPALVLHVHDPDLHAGLWFNLTAGGTMLAAWFIVTDPVSAPTTARGRLLYAGAIGALTLFVREAGGYPDGIAFAVLTVNAAAALLERITIPPVLGERR